MAEPHLEYDVVDVFAEEPFAGNQLAVVHGAAELSDDQLLALTREFGFSETTFPTPLAEDRYRVRIFTPGGEIPFAGHPTLGTAWVLRGNGLIAGDAVQVCGAGEIGVRFDEGGMVELSAVRRDLGPVPDEVVATLLADLGLDTSVRAGEARFAGAGLTFVHLPVTDHAVGAARPALRPMSDCALGTVDPLEGINLYAVTGTGQVHARVFVPGVVPEDPATGSAAAGLGLVLADLGMLPEDGRFTISQGIELGRPSRLHVRVPDGGVGRVDGVGLVDRVHVAGAVLPIASGRIRVP